MLVDTFGANADGLGFAHDGEKLADALKSHLTRDLGPGRCLVDILTGKEATSARVLQYYRDVLSTPEDTLVFVGLSHGVIDPVRGHYLEMSSGRLYRSQLRQAMEARNPRLLVLWTGSCAAPAYRFDRPQSRLNPPYPAALGLKSDSLEPLPAALQTRNTDGGNHLLRNLLLEHRGVVDVNASMAGTLAYASFGHYQYFIQGLATLVQRPPHDLDSNGDGFITWQEFLPALQRRTAQLAAAEGIWQVPESFAAVPSAPLAAPNWLDSKQEIPLPLIARTALVLGSEGPKNLPLLQKALQSKQPQARRLALLSLVYMSSWDKRKALPSVQAALKDNDPLTRALAIEAMRDMRPTKAILPTLEPLLQGKEKQSRRGALYVLNQLGPQGLPAFPLLEKVYEGEDDALTRADMVYTYTKIAPWKMQTWRVVEAALKDKAPIVRTQSIYALYNVPLLAARNEVIAQLKLMATRDEDPDVRVAALRGLSNLGDTAIYRQGLHHPNPRVRMAALDGFPTAGPKAEAALPDIVLALQDEAASVRLKALATLQRFGPTAKKVEADLVRALGSDSPDEAIKAALALRAVSPRNKAVLPALIKCLQDPRVEDWDRVTYFVGDYGARARPAIPSLLVLLQHRDPYVRSHTISTLEQIRVDGNKVARALIKLVRDPDVGVRRQVFYALAGALRSETRSFLPELRVGLKDPDPTVQREATRIFVHWEESSPAVLAVLFRELDDYSSVAREDAVASLARLAPRNKAIIPYLIKALNDKAPEVRQNTAEVVGRLGHDAKAAEENLRGLLKDSNFGVRVAAAVALWRVTGAAEPALASLAGLTRHTSPAVRGQAARALGQMGSIARSQALALRSLLQDPDRYVRWAAADALRRIDRRFTRASWTMRAGTAQPFAGAVAKSR
jgi:HEAT repeat protein